jgi:hypothetical protein
MTTIIRTQIDIPTDLMTRIDETATAQSVTTNSLIVGALEREFAGVDVEDMRPAEQLADMPDLQKIWEDA